MSFDDGSFDYRDEDTEFKPTTTGWHNAVLCEFVNLGEQPNQWEAGGRPQKRGLLLFQVEEAHPTGERKEIWFYFNRHLGSKDKPSKFRQLIEDWRGETFSMEDMADPAKRPNVYDYIGKSAKIMVRHKAGKANPSKVFAEIGGIGPAETDIEVLGYRPYADRKMNKTPSAPVEESAPTDSDGVIPF